VSFPIKSIVMLVYQRVDIIDGKWGYLRLFSQFFCLTLMEMSFLTGEIGISMASDDIPKCT
jgi:hypothetical protein